MMKKDQTYFESGHRKNFSVCLASFSTLGKKRLRITKFSKPHILICQRQKKQGDLIFTTEIVAKLII